MGGTHTRQLTQHLQQLYLLGQGALSPERGSSLTVNEKQAVRTGGCNCGDDSGRGCWACAWVLSLLACPPFHEETEFIWEPVEEACLSESGVVWRSLDLTGNRKAKFPTMESKTRQMGKAAATGVKSVMCLVLSCLL